MPMYNRSSATIRGKSSLQDTFHGAAYSSDRKVATNVPKTLNLRERLFTSQLAKRQSQAPLRTGIGEAKSKPKLTTSSFSRKLYAGGSEKQEPLQSDRFTYGLSHASMLEPGFPLTSSMEIGSSPLVESPLLRELRDEYIVSAIGLHATACTQLAAVHRELEESLARIIAEDNLVREEDRIYRALISQPFSTFRLETVIQGVEGQVHCRQETVAELVNCFCTQLQQTKDELEVLWQEWEAAQLEVQGTLGELVLEHAPGHDGSSPQDQIHVRGDKNNSDSANAIQEEFRTEMGRIQDDMNALAKQSFDKMKNVEKGFRKAIQPDFMLFYESLFE